MSRLLRAPSREVQRGLIGGLMLLGGWEAATRLFKLPAYVLPPVSGIVEAIVERRAALLAAAGYTASEALIGYAIGCAVGIGLAMLLALFPRPRRAFVSMATAVNSIPVVGYAPLLLLWFGTGIASKIAAVAFAVSFVVFISTLSGLDRVDKRAVDLMRSFGAGKVSILWRLQLPTALPLIAAGMRVSTVRSIIIAIVVEMLGAYGGLGWVIYQAVMQIDFVQVWAAIFVASAISLLFFNLIGLAEWKLVFWR
ncbi:NitT/TauT family transport system permease protein [Enhydrobacter aerosaccus]|uniref:NitT/TauT family transport system permease protein n=1 Tax=Enhydrobacter aerosaccus TaxID=225324 RepID=A0A1T4JQM4_9HYPH|nr:ABC transporter permease [Enhydrobacter aerosaccus]SJZ32454.1 NitT/TauT family transport system permease protein [Enhydrobacter aerosaccus]